jgi:hypothetical protein
MFKSNQAGQGGGGNDADQWGWYKLVALFSNAALETSLLMWTKQAAARKPASPSIGMTVVLARNPGLRAGADWRADAPCVSGSH